MGLRVLPMHGLPWPRDANAQATIGGTRSVPQMITMDNLFGGCCSVIWVPAARITRSSRLRSPCGPHDGSESPSAFDCVQASVDQTGPRTHSYVRGLRVRGWAPYRHAPEWHLSVGVIAARGEWRSPNALYGFVGIGAGVDRYCGCLLIHGGTFTSGCPGGRSMPTWRQGLGGCGWVVDRS